MGPRALLNKFFQEFGGRDRSAIASFADVLDVGDFTGNQLGEKAVHRKRPCVFATFVGALFDFRLPCIVVAHEARDLVAKSNHASSRECSEVNDTIRF